MDVYVTLFISSDRPRECVALLQSLGCSLTEQETTAQIQSHGFCRVYFQKVRVDVFLPTIPFYELAKARRARVPLKQSTIAIWDAETLAVFKMMFFREKDFVDLRKILLSRGPLLDRNWIRERLVEIYGGRDTRILRWDEMAASSAT
jgi:hypothetical protein